MRLGYAKVALGLRLVLLGLRRGVRGSAGVALALVCARVTLGLL